MPFLMAISHSRWLRTKEPVYLDLTKAWSKGVAIFFATGAVSGTVLSFELGLLWPIVIRRDAVQTARLLVAAQVGLVLIGWYRLQYPVIINSSTTPLTICAAAAPEPTLRYLLYALIAGSFIIFPALIYLLKIFKVPEADDLASALPPR
jgi:cytochrome bd-type quinol oxidase subunit 2